MEEKTKENVVFIDDREAKQKGILPICLNFYEVQSVISLFAISKPLRITTITSERMRGEIIDALKTKIINIEFNFLVTQAMNFNETFDKYFALESPTKPSCIIKFADPVFPTLNGYIDRFSYDAVTMDRMINGVMHKEVINTSIKMLFSGMNDIPTKKGEIKQIMPRILTRRLTF